MRERDIKSGHRITIQSVVLGETRMTRTGLEIGEDEIKTPKRTISYIAYNEDSGEIYFARSNEMPLGTEPDDYPKCSIKDTASIDNTDTPETWENFTKSAARSKTHRDVQIEYDKRGALPGHKIERRTGFLFESTAASLYKDKEKSPPTDNNEVVIDEVSGLVYAPLEPEVG